MENKFVVWFKDVGHEDVGTVGGKGANLGEMTQIGIPVPPGFIVTAGAYFHFLKENKLGPKIKNYLAGLDRNDPVALQRVSIEIKRLISHSEIPEEVSRPIIDYYEELRKGKFLPKLIGREPLVAVRSSATAEDLPTASFAGQQATFLNISGEANVVNAVRDAWASLFEARAIFYREENHFDHFKVGIAVPIQRMVESDTSGVMFTIDPITNNKKIIVIEAIRGLGELIVQGEVTPDHYEVEKSNLKIIQKKTMPQTVELTRSSGGKTAKRPVSRLLKDKRKLTDSQIIKLAILGKKLENHYFHPQDIEFAIEDGVVYIVQTRPITTVKVVETEQKQEKAAAILKHGELLLTGAPASPGIRIGPVKILESARDIGKINFGDVLVAPQTNPDYVPAMKKASAIVTDSGGRTSHAAIVSRELGIPAVVGTGEATKKLKNGLVVTVDGTTGKVYRGGQLLGHKIGPLPSGVASKVYIPEGTTLKTATRLYVNLAEPEKAQEVAKMNVDGVGLLRAEFILAQIGKHPKEIIEKGEQKVFINELADSLKIFAQSFYPRPVVYRATDFKTNEYRNLKGGEKYEPKEPNPMLGFRGVSRYIAWPDVFKMEMEALKIVRNKHGFKNLSLMLPFVRTIRELIEVKSLLHTAGLPRTASFKLWIMVEVPSTVVMLDKFIETGIDGVSIGNNDLTMMMLGTDRDNEAVAAEYDETNPALLWAYQHVIETCKKYGVTSSMCGQAPSTYPDLVKKLVEWGITSISVSPDAVYHMREVIYEAENAKARKK